MPSASARLVRSCPCCGLAHRLPALDAAHRACCTRCGSTIVRQGGHATSGEHEPGRHTAASRSAHRTAALAIAAIIIYPAAVLLPIMRIEQFGHTQATSILGGTIDLLAGGHIGIGIVILVCSVIVPVAKLTMLLALVTRWPALTDRNRALAHRLLEWTGRWGMLDVLAVAVVVAALKLGDVVEVAPGSGALAFAAVVSLSLLASATFNPHLAWEHAEHE